jgi:hypothetical protein
MAASESVQYLHPINEDSDRETYTIEEGEETPGLTEKANDIPEKAYKMKEGDQSFDYLSDPTPQSSEFSSAPASDASPTPFSELEESDTQPMPPDSEPEDSIAEEARMSQLISRSLRMAATASQLNTDPVLPPKPT